jgi:hypothetical protein
VVSILPLMEREAFSQASTAAESHGNALKSEL